MKDITKKYTNGEVTIVWKPATCIHSTICWKRATGLPEVFNPMERPWIKPEGANTERIVDGVLFTTTASSSSTRPNHDGTAAKGYRVFYIGADLSVRTTFREVKP